MTTPTQIPLQDDTVLNDLFLSIYLKEVERMGAIVANRDETGRNAVVPLPEMFASGLQTVFDLIWMKLARARGYAKTGRMDLVSEELRDLANYSLFGVVLAGTGSLVVG